MEPFLGTIQLFAFDFVPRGWAACEGQLLPIAQNSALFALLGTTYGGDGQSTFALPDLRGRVPVGRGQGPALSARDLGATGGAEEVTLRDSQLPSHSHDIRTAAAPTSKSPDGNLPGVATGGAAYGSDPAGVMSTNAVSDTGHGAPHNNMPPYLVAQWCIALTGIFPSRE